MRSSLNRAWQSQAKMAPDRPRLMTSAVVNHFIKIQAQPARIDIGLDRLLKCFETSPCAGKIKTVRGPFSPPCKLLVDPRRLFPSGPR